jgi:outer membrane lipoprotein carrier protein
MAARTKLQRRNARAVALAVLAICAFASGSAATEPSPDASELLHGLQAWLDDAGSLTGRFEQSRISGAIGEGLTESGQIWIRRPGKSRWDYTDPEIKVAILNGTKTLFYQAEEQQMIRADLADGGGLLAALLAGDDSLEKHFLAERIVRPDLEDGRGWFLRLIPREKVENFEEITIFLGRKHQLRAVEVLDATGNRILYRFPDLKRNRRVSDAIFEFSPPPGTDILENVPSD